MNKSLDELRRRIKAGTLKKQINAIVPEQCETGWGKATWREPLERTTRVVNVTGWDLCEIGYTLAGGFLRHADWDYTTLSMGQSWIRERQWCGIDPGSNSHDREFAEDLIDLADIVHLNGGHDWWFLDRLDLRGKRLLIHHHGGTYRRTWRRLEVLETRAGYGRLVSTPDLLMYARGGRFAPAEWLPHPVDLSELDRAIPRWEKPDGGPVDVLHAYTIKGNKGTDQFLSSCAEAQRMGARLRPGLIHYVSRRQSLWLISQADIYFASFHNGPGMAALEAMAMGIPTLAGCSEAELGCQLRALDVSRAEELPWLYVTPENCGRVLRELAADADLRRHWGEKGRRYVEQWHSAPVVVEKLMGIYERTPECRGVVVGNAVVMGK
ncbi:MAG TPA: hypothetical protein DGT21_08110 [Armatimonadetes bacterium]|nr:hypothetical protein [Armatimonadota bacterium]